jgi:hypothetical protein
LTEFVFSTLEGNNLDFPQKIISDQSEKKKIVDRRKKKKKKREARMMNGAIMMAVALVALVVISSAPIGTHASWWHSPRQRFCDNTRPEWNVTHGSTAGSFNKVGDVWAQNYTIMRNFDTREGTYMDIAKIIYWQFDTYSRDECAKITYGFWPRGPGVWALSKVYSYLQTAWNGEETYRIVFDDQYPLYDQRAALYLQWKARSSAHNLMHSLAINPIDNKVFMSEEIWNVRDYEHRYYSQSLARPEDDTALPDWGWFHSHATNLHRVPDDVRGAFNALFNDELTIGDDILAQLDGVPSWPIKMYVHSTKRTDDAVAVAAAPAAQPYDKDEYGNRLCVGLEDTPLGWITSSNIDALEAHHQQHHSN